MTVLLEAHEIPKECWLWEALNYLGRGIIPVERQSPSLVDPPAERTNIDTYVPSYWPACQRRFNFSLVDGDRHKAVSNDEPPESNSYDLARIDLFAMLTDGRLPARGRWFDEPYVLHEIGESKKIPEAEQNASFDSIPTDFWELDSIDWRSSYAVGWMGPHEAAYYQIIVDFERLLQICPIPDGQPIGGVRLALGQLMLDELREVAGNDAADEPNKHRGRKPKFDRKAIEEEAVRRLLQDRAPSLFKTFVQDLKIWCKEQSLEVPSDSTMHDFVKRFHTIWEEQNSLKEND